MTDALHRCKNCGIADEDVTDQLPVDAEWYSETDRNTPHPHAGQWVHGAQFACSDSDCLQAALRQLAASNALVERCRDRIELLIDYTERDVARCYKDGPVSAAATYKQIAANDRALLADIDSTRQPK